jgi:hypothetical protein
MSDWREAAARWQRTAADVRGNTQPSNTSCACDAAHGMASGLPEALGNMFFGLEGDTLRDTAGGVWQRRGCEPWSWCQRTRRMSTMHHEDIDVTWSEVVTALAVLGIIMFLLLH